MAAGSVDVRGLRELIRAADAAGKETKKLVRDRLREVGRIVQVDAASRFSRIDSRSAAGFGVSVRRTGLVAVEQRLRRTTGKHPSYGRLQMNRALEPALDAQTDAVVRSFEKALDDIADIFERG